MTKQHLIAIAKEFKNSFDYALIVATNHKSDDAVHAVEHTIHAFCNAAAQFNPRFDRARFLTACGLN